MLYQTNRYSEKIPPLINLQMLLALGGGLVAAAQALLIVLEGKILCLNNGCEIVETLTTVPPIAFNVVGGLFFMAIFLALWQGARGVHGWLSMARVLLLAAMAAEGVLIGFQYYVAQVFCSYCLIIFTLVVMLNLLMGWQHMMAGMAIGGAVLLAFASLQFVPHSQAVGLSLESGVYGRLVRAGKTDNLYLFFSASCPHCEDVIATLDQDFTCSLNFNPVEEIEDPPLAEVLKTPGYLADMNRRYLKNLGVTEIPVLVARGSEEVRVVKGKKAILAYFTGQCRAVADRRTSDGSGPAMSRTQGVAAPYLTAPADDGTCAVDSECEQEKDVLSLPGQQRKN